MKSSKITNNVCEEERSMRSILTANESWGCHKGCPATCPELRWTTSKEPTGVCRCDAAKAAAKRVPAVAAFFARLRSSFDQFLRCTAPLTTAASIKTASLLETGIHIILLISLNAALRKDRDCNNMEQIEVSFEKYVVYNVLTSISGKDLWHDLTVKIVKKVTNRVIWTNWQRYAGWLRFLSLIAKLASDKPIKHGYRCNQSELIDYLAFARNISF